MNGSRRYHELRHTAGMLPSVLPTVLILACTDLFGATLTVSSEPQAILVDHNCVDTSGISQELADRAASLRILMRHASVGTGIEWGLECMAGAKSTNAACKGFPPGMYDRSNWVLEQRAGNWKDKMDDLVAQVAARTDDFDIFMTKLCYIDALGDSHPDWDYCRETMEQLEADYPDKRFVWWTIPLTRDGMPGSDWFNEKVRTYCAANNKILFDIADIECYDLSGQRLTNAEGNETISAEYTNEIHAGHLNIEGRIRVAAAMWNLMTQLAANHQTIQSAIDDAADSDIVIVADGTYTGPGNRDIDFKGKAIALRSTDPNDPDIVAATIISGGGTHRGFYFHSAEGRGSILEGLTITDCMASFGAGILCTSGASPTIRNNVIRDNHIPFDDDGGAGIGCWDGVSPLIVGNIISDNYCEPGGGGGGIRCYEAGEVMVVNNVLSGNSASQGGGMCINFCSPVITNCTFVGNLATSMGGGLLTDRDLTISDCTFVGNQAQSGGGLYNYYCSTTLLRCRFAGNAAEYQGGAIFNTDGCITILRGSILSGNLAGDIGGAIYYHNYDGTYRPTCVNTTFSGNKSPLGNALACRTHLWTAQQSVHLSSCILLDGDGEIWTDTPAAVTVSHSSVHGGWPGQGNVDTDPYFADPGTWDPNGTSEDANDDFWVDGDYHIKSQAGRWDPNIKNWVQDDVTSPCIDAGDPMTPIGHEPFPNGGVVNMGAYGATAEAGKSYFGGPVCDTIVAGDINGDCKVDFNDFSVLAMHWMAGEML